MNFDATTLMLLLGPLLFLFFLALRMIRVMRREAMRNLSQPLPKDLLLETLHQQTLAERDALAQNLEQQQALEALNILHRTIMTHIPIAIMVLDDQGNITFENAHSQQLLQKEVHTNIQDLPHDIEQLFTDLKQEEQSSKEETIQFIQPTGLRTIKASISPLPEQRFLLTLVDKTLEKQLEERIRYKRDLELMGELAGGITHEVKNALAVIQGRVQMLAYGDVAKNSEQIMQEVNRLLDFTKEFTRSSKNSHVDLHPIHLSTWLEELRTEWIQHPQGAHVQIQKLDDPDLEIYGDKVLLAMVIRNLIRNGIQACEALTSSPWVTLEVIANPDQIILEVKDKGPGFPAEIRDRIFVPFLSSKEDGSGLGLFQCRKTMMEHQGNLEVEPGPPTSLRCIFPRKVL